MASSNPSGTSVPSTSGGSQSPPVRKTAKPCPSHVKSKYQSEWSYKYRMKPSSIGESYIFCTVCQLDFSIAGGGMHQVKRHCQSKRHTDRMKDMKRQPTLQASLKNTATQTFQDQVNCAELYFAMYITEHNLPLLLLTILTSYAQ